LLNVVRCCVEQRNRQQEESGRMKGPSLRYDVRVLRVFCCDACGRQVQTRGNVTSQTCQCSDPPKFMRPLERPRTVSPDVSRFLSPADPSELIEVEEIDEAPHVPHVPIKPPPPARFANRRKLYDETAKEAEPDFGDGIASDQENAAISDVAVSDAAVSDAAVSADDPFDNSTLDSEVLRTSPPSGNRDRNGDYSRQRRGRGGARRADSQGPGASQQDQRSRAAGSKGTKPAPPLKRDPRPKAEESIKTQNSKIADNATAPRDAAGKPQDSEKGEGRQRSRRRGRRRGPRPEGSGA